MKNGNCPSGVSAASVSPFDKHRAGETVEDHALRRAFAFNRRLLTRRVKGGIRKFVRHAPDNAVILAKYKPANCRL